MQQSKLTVVVSRHAMERAAQRKVAATKYSLDWNTVCAVATQRGIVNGSFNIGEWKFVVEAGTIVTCYRAGFRD